MNASAKRVLHERPLRHQANRKANHAVGASRLGSPDRMRRTDRSFSIQSHTRRRSIMETHSASAAIPRVFVYDLFQTKSTGEEVFVNTFSTKKSAIDMANRLQHAALLFGCNTSYRVVRHG